MTTTFRSPVLGVPPADPADAAAHFTARLCYEVDVSDVATALRHRDPGFVLVDSRGEASWAQGRIPGAVHLPTARVAADAPGLLDQAVPVVTYCWGPGCNGATRAALEFARAGYRVKEMLGGLEYWVREGLAVVTDAGTGRRPIDPLTAPAGPVCDC